MTVQQDFFKLEGPNQVILIMSSLLKIIVSSFQIPRSRQRAIEMYRPKYWDDVTRLDTGAHRPGSVLSVRVEVGPADREAREDFNRFVEEMLDTSSRQSGAYDRRYLTGVPLALCANYNNFFCVLFESVYFRSDYRGKTATDAAFSRFKSSSVFQK